MSLGEDQPPPAKPARYVVIAPEKIMVVQVMLAIRAWTPATLTAVCSPGSSHIRHSLLADDCIDMRFNGEDDERFVERMNRLEQERPGQVLVPADTSGTRLLNRTAARLHSALAPAPDDTMLDQLDHKGHFHQLCEELGLGVPDTMMCADKHALSFAEAVERVGLPFMVKPVAEAQARGAHVIASEAELRRRIVDDPDYRYAPLLVQRYIAGTDICISLAARDGEMQAVAVQQREGRELASDPVRFLYSDSLLRSARTLCAATAYDGVLHIDARLEAGSGRVYLIEANPRYWRSLCASVWCGLNLAAENLSPPSGQPLRVLASGRSDIYHHPLFRPTLWPQLALGRGPRARLLRAMATDTCTLFNSARILMR